MTRRYDTDMGARVSRRGRRRRRRRTLDVSDTFMPFTHAMYWAVPAVTCARPSARGERGEVRSCVCMCCKGRPPPAAGAASHGRRAAASTYRLGQIIVEVDRVRRAHRLRGPARVRCKLQHTHTHKSCARPRAFACAHGILRVDHNCQVLGRVRGRAAVGPRGRGAREEETKRNNRRLEHCESLLEVCSRDATPCRATDAVPWGAFSARRCAGSSSATETGRPGGAGGACWRRGIGASMCVARAALNAAR